MLIKQLNLLVSAEHVPALDKKHSHVTNCDLLNAETKEILGSGSAYCVKEDMFVRRHGFRLALTRALKAASLSKEDRTIVWARAWNNKYSTDKRNKKNRGK